MMTAIVNQLKDNTMKNTLNTAPTIHYQLDFSRYLMHLVDIRIRFTADTCAPVLWLPTWIAGSYLIREFSKNITTVYYQTTDGRLQRAEKLDKNHYQLSNIKAGDTVSVSYEVYCHDLSVRTAFIDGTRLFGNFSSLILMIEGAEYADASATLSIPSAFSEANPDSTLACGLKHSTEHTPDATLYTLERLPAFSYYDYPFEISTQASFSFNVDTPDKQVPHRFFIAGKHRANLPRLKADIQAICQTYVSWLGHTPFNDYTFMTMVTGSDYGGLEHINSTALISPRSDMPSLDEPALPSADYQRYLGLCSHEYFHAWWVKSVKPVVMVDNLLQSESYTPLLWVFEGFTSYLDDLMLLMSGVIDKPSYYKLLEAQINRYYQTDGRAHQSVAESSFDTWIKLYRPDENTANQGVSYYNKGALVALLLDLTLLIHSDGKYRIFDVIKQLYDTAVRLGQGASATEYGITTDTLGDVVTEMIGAEQWLAFYKAYVIGTDALPLTEMLNAVGIKVTTKDTDKPWGMSITEGSTGLSIKTLTRDSAATAAGLSAGDVIIAIDGIKASQAVLTSAIRHQNSTGEPISVHAFRRDELIAVSVALKASGSRPQLSLSGDGGRWLDVKLS